MGGFLGGFTAGVVCVGGLIAICATVMVRSGSRPDLYDHGRDPRTERLASGATPERDQGGPQ